MIKIIVVLLFLAGVGYYVLQNGVPEEIPVDTLSTKITREQALKKVKKLPEVQQYLQDVPGGIVEVDNELEGEYNIHVYEVKNGHTATFNWYRVSIKSGEIRPEFEVTTEKESEKPKGTITGKLCYPSEVIPAGRIEAKRLSDGKFFNQEYLGTENGGKTTYAFELESGEYSLRFVVGGIGSYATFGYSTTVCPTGQEETCGDTKKRIPRKAFTKPGQTVSGYDLCDFYYSDKNAPGF